MKKRAPQANLKNDKAHFLNPKGYQFINLQLSPALYQIAKSKSKEYGIPLTDIIKMSLIQFCK